MADFKKLKDGQGNSYNVKDETARTNLASHTGNTSNPHSVTKAQVGLGNVDNTSDVNKPISNAQAAVNATKFDKANVKAIPASIPSNDNVVSEKYSEETYAKKDGYYETFGYAREAGIASNLKNDEGKLLDPDTATSSGTIYADQPFTQRATAMTMNAYLNDELITVGSGYEQWKKEQAFSVVRNQYVNFVNTSTSQFGITYDYSVDGTITANGTSTDVSSTTYFSNIQCNIIAGHTYIYLIEWKNNNADIDAKFIVGGATSNLQYTELGYNQNGIILKATTNGTNPYTILRIPNGKTVSNLSVKVKFIDLTQWFASRPEIATALNGDAGIKWFLQNYPQATTLGYDEGTIVDTEDYEYQTTGVNLWDEEWEVLYTNFVFSKNYIRVFPNTTYYYKNATELTSTLYYYDKDKALISQVNFATNNSFTTPSGCYYIKFSYQGTTYNHDIQICNHFTETSIEQTYHPYEIYKDRVSWAFTSTGKGKSAGKVADTKDYVNKKNIEKVGRVDLGTLDWTKGGTNFSAPFISVCGAKQPTNAQTPKLLCSKQMTPKSQDAISGNLGTFEAYITQGGYLCWYYTLEDFVDGNAFKTAMSGVILNYELATPVETDMTGDELGTNIPENDYGVERKVPLSGNMFSGSATTIFYQDNVLRQIYNNKTSIDNLQGEVNNIEARIPTAPTTDGTYTLKAVVSNGVVTYSWTLDSQGV